MEQALSALQEAGSHFRARLVLQRCLMYYQQAVKKLSENRMTRGKQIIGKVILGYASFSHFTLLDTQRLRIVSLPSSLKFPSVL